MGDTLVLYDQGTITISATDVRKPKNGGPGDRVVVTFETVETIELRAAAGTTPNTINVVGTATGITVKVTGGAGVDVITVAGTGADAHLIIDAKEGADQVTILATGGDDNDPNNADGNNDKGSFVLVNSGSEKDTIEIGSPGGSLSVIGGIICVNGEVREGGTELHGEIALSCGESNSSGNMFVGDTLLLYDDGAMANNEYVLDVSSFKRVGNDPINFENVETIELWAAAAAAQNTITVKGTQADVTVKIMGGSGTDTITVEGTGLDSQVIIQAGDGADVIKIVTTGGDGEDKNNAADDNGVGSVVLADGGAGNDILTLLENGALSHVQLSGGEGTDTVYVESVAAGSFVAVSGGGGNDVINVGGPLTTLDEIRGSVCVSGDDNDRGVTQSAA